MYRILFVIGLAGGLAFAAEKIHNLKGEYYYNTSATFSSPNKTQTAKNGATAAQEFCTEKHFPNVIAFYFETVGGATYKVTDVFCSEVPKSIKTEALGRLVISRSRQDRQARVGTSALELMQKLGDVQVKGFTAIDATNGN